MGSGRNDQGGQPGLERTFSTKALTERVCWFLWHKSSSRERSEHWLRGSTSACGSTQRWGGAPLSQGQAFRQASNDFQWPLLAADQLSSPIAWTLGIKRNGSERTSEFIPKLLTLVSFFLATAPQLVLCRRRSRRSWRCLPGSHQRFPSIFCLFWSNPGNGDRSLPEADLVDKFLTSLCSSEMKNAEKLFLDFAEESVLPLQSWLNF